LNLNFNVYYDFIFSGGTYFDLFTAFRIPETTLSYLIPEVCEAIYTVLKDTFLKVHSYILHRHV